MVTMVVGLGGCGIGNYRYLFDKVLHEEAAGNNRGVCTRDTNIQNLYRGREAGGLQ